MATSLSMVELAESPYFASENVMGILRTKLESPTERDPVGRPSKLQAAVLLDQRCATTRAPIGSTLNLRHVLTCPPPLSVSVSRQVLGVHRSDAGRPLWIVAKPDSTGDAREQGRLPALDPSVRSLARFPNLDPASGRADFHLLASGRVHASRKVTHAVSSDSREIKARLPMAPTISDVISDLQAFDFVIEPDTRALDHCEAYRTGPQNDEQRRLRGNEQEVSLHVTTNYEPNTKRLYVVCSRWRAEVQ